MRVFLACLLSGAALLGARAPVLAQEALAEAEGAAVGRVIAMLDRGEYAAAREALEPLVAARDPDATYVLGYVHARGLGGPPDETEARRLFVAAAMDGQPDAQFALGELAYTGRGVQRDWGRAYEWYNLAAAKGHAKALYMLGVMHAEGQHVPEDLTRAASLYERAAERGSLPAMHQLGALYLEGGGVAQSYERAAAWFERAAQRGDTDSQYNLALLYDAERLPGPARLDEAVRWMERAASQSPQAQIAMGLFALRGRGTEQSDAAARAWFRRAAASRNAEGMFLYAAALAEGLGGPVEPREALSWAEQALRASAGEPIEVLDERRRLRDALRAALDAPQRVAPRTADARPIVAQGPSAAPEGAAEEGGARTVASAPPTPLLNVAPPADPAAVAAEINPRRARRRGLRR